VYLHAEFAFRADFSLATFLTSAVNIVNWSIVSSMVFTDSGISSQSGYMRHPVSIRNEKNPRASLHLQRDSIPLTVSFNSNVSQQPRSSSSDHSLCHCDGFRHCGDGTDLVGQVHDNEVDFLSQDLLEDQGG
jgi:hypothetical protein